MDSLHNSICGSSPNKPDINAKVERGANSHVDETITELKDQLKVFKKELSQTSRWSWDPNVKAKRVKIKEQMKSYRAIKATLRELQAGLAKTGGKPDEMSLLEDGAKKAVVEARLIFTVGTSPCAKENIPAKQTHVNTVATEVTDLFRQVKDSLQQTGIAAGEDPKAVDLLEARIEKLSKQMLIPETRVALEVFSALNTGQPRYTLSDVGALKKQAEVKKKDLTLAAQGKTGFDEAVFTAKVLVSGAAHSENELVEFNCMLAELKDKQSTMTPAQLAKEYVAATKQISSRAAELKRRVDCRNAATSSKKLGEDQAAILNATSERLGASEVDTVRLDPVRLDPAIKELAGIKKGLDARRAVLDSRLNRALTAADFRSIAAGYKKLTEDTRTACIKGEALHTAVKAQQTKTNVQQRWGKTYISGVNAQLDNWSNSRPEGATYGYLKTARAQIEKFREEARNLEEGFDLKQSNGGATLADAKTFHEKSLALIKRVGKEKAKLGKLEDAMKETFTELTAAAKDFDELLLSLQDNKVKDKALKDSSTLFDAYQKNETVAGRKTYSRALKALTAKLKADHGS